MLFCLFTEPVTEPFVFASWTRYQNVCVWFMARNCRFPKVGTSLLATWEPQVTIARNCRLPEVGTHGSQPGKPEVYHCKQLPVPTWEPQVTTAKNFQFLKVGTDGSQRGNQRLPWQGTAGSQTLKLTVSQPGKPEVYHCKELPLPRS